MDDGVGEEGKARFVPDVDVVVRMERVLGPARFARSTLEASFSLFAPVVSVELECDSEICPRHYNVPTRNDPHDTRFENRPNTSP